MFAPVLYQLRQPCIEKQNRQHPAHQLDEQAEKNELMGLWVKIGQETGQEVCRRQSHKVEKQDVWQVCRSWVHVGLRTDEKGAVILPQAITPGGYARFSQDP
ncbi:MAG: hypothetical protein MZV64_59620 [Ignavibacteriales bacterium]|nr:hypothetical protein [Ignavibacteriales bacterium]